MAGCCKFNNPNVMMTTEGERRTECTPLLHEAATRETTQHSPPNAPCIQAHFRHPGASLNRHNNRVVSFIAFGWP